MTKYDKTIGVKLKKRSIPKPEDAPVCEREGCQNRVKWASSSWRTFCGEECRKLSSTIFGRPINLKQPQ